MAFIDEDTTENVIHRWLKATRKDKLKVQKSLPILRLFIQKAFIVNYTARNTEKTKELDDVT